MGRLDGARFTYKNYRGETNERCVLPISIRFGSTGWHPKDQWLLKARDLLKDEIREFAMSEIKDWKPMVIK